MSSGIRQVAVRWALWGLWRVYVLHKRWELGWGVATALLQHIVDMEEVELGVVGSSEFSGKIRNLKFYVKSEMLATKSIKKQKQKQCGPNKAVGCIWPAGGQFVMLDIESQRDLRHSWV